MRKITVVMALLLAAACGSKSPTPSGTGAVEPAAGLLAAGQWDAMDHEAREDFMSKAVLPIMAEKFKAFNADQYSDFDCASCHGAGAADDTFKMPSPDLPSLSMEEIQNPDADHQAITEFMMTTVKPTVANLLGEPEVSDENPQGFGCFNCHTMKP